jgi:DNA-binding PadR family transcriptional regulator
MGKKSSKQAIFENLALELRRGALTLAVLSRLQEERYGYDLKQSLDARGLEINEGTLYPLLRRLEKQGLLESDWKIEGGSRPRRYYRLNQTGATVLANLTIEWQSLVGVMHHLLYAEDEVKSWKQMN